MVLWDEVNLTLKDINVFTKRLIFYEDKGLVYLMDKVRIKGLTKSFDITAKKGEIDLQKEILILKGDVYASFKD